MATEVDFVTLGMFIIDDIYPPPHAPDQTPRRDVIGGAGTYSVIGARLFSPPPRSKSIGWVVDAGTDFPPQVRQTIECWQTGALMRSREGLTTRGWNGYGENDHRAFKYLTEKKRITADDLTPDLLASKTFHLICNPTRCVDLVQRILERRSEYLTVDAAPPRPLFIWEPVPDLCIPSELDNTLAALAYVDVISPNHEELASLYNQPHPAIGISKPLVEEHVDNLIENHGVGPSSTGAVVVRSGKEGCYVSQKWGMERWLPAYHTDSKHVVDPTGGGNGFLGGFAIGLARDQSIFESAKMGNVAASFCIEQVGMPILTPARVGDNGVEEPERWNHVVVAERLEEYRQRVS